MDASLATTPLYAWHQAHQGRLVDFAGWAMPVQYTSISAEHLATRNAATLFDVSHMGRFRCEGPGTIEWLDGILSRRVTDLRRGRIRYSLVTRDDGGILDDILVYRLDEDSSSEKCLLVVNASNRGKIWDWLESRRPADNSVRMVDQTEATAMIAVQGPLAVGLLTDQLGLSEFGGMKYYSCRRFEREGATLLCSRTGYTGEDGGELIVPAALAESIWCGLLAAGGAAGVQAAGLGARDTLRLEAALPLYGHELTEQLTPWQADLAFAVDLDHRHFPGCDALRSIHPEELPRRVGLRLSGKRVARQFATVFDVGGATTGQVTSGTFSPSLQQSIAMAYVAADQADVGTQLTVDVRGRQEMAEVVELPFYRRARS